MPGDPGAEVIAAFGCEPAGLTTRLPGGQGRAFRRGDLFLKPVDDPAEASWCADPSLGIGIRSHAEADHQVHPHRDLLEPRRLETLTRHLVFSRYLSIAR